MGNEDDLSGGIITAKSLLLEVRADVKTIGRNVDLLVGQNLDIRIQNLERWKDQVLIEGARAAADTQATPVGRWLETGRIANATRIARLEKTVWIATGAVIVAMTAVNIIIRLI